MARKAPRRFGGQRRVQLVGRDVVDRRHEGRAAAGVVERDVQALERLHGALHERGDGAVVGHLGRDRDRSSPGGADLGRQGL
jgi:hypothetical protein